MLGICTVTILAQLLSCVLRLGHSKLNIDGRYNQICQCGAIKTSKLTCFLSVLPPVRRTECCLQMSLKILAKENVFSYSEFAALCFPTLSLLH